MVGPDKAKRCIKLCPVSHVHHLVTTMSLPSPYRDIDIGGIKFDAAADAPLTPGGNQRAADPRKPSRTRCPRA
jgi:hypothetical protein